MSVFNHFYINITLRYIKINQGDIVERMSGLFRLYHFYDL